MEYFIGVDIGTTSTKTVAFSREGLLLESVSVSYGMRHPKPGFSEQDPVEILNAVVHGLNKIYALYLPAQPLFISFCSAMHSLMAVNAKGEPLSPCIIWADTRAAAVADVLRARPEGKLFYQKTGVPVHPMSPLTKLIWLREHEPELFASAYKFIGLKEFVFHAFFGRFVTDSSVAASTGIMNGISLNWDVDILSYAGMKTGSFSEIVSSTTIFEYKGNYAPLTLPAGIPFVIGISDGAASNLGSGATHPRSMAVTIGTSGAARKITEHFTVDDQMRTFCYHVNGSRYISGGASNNGGVVLQWLKDRVLESGLPFEEFLELGATVPAGSEGLLMLPYLLGERAPVWDARARGVFFAMDIRHGKAHFVRAAMEAVIFSVCGIGKILLEKEPVDFTYASGGFARKADWLQMLADVLQLPVKVSNAPESSALGAALLGAEAMGMPVELVEENETTVEPDAAHAEVYTAAMDKFTKLYQLLRSEMSGSV